MVLVRIIASLVMVAIGVYIATISPIISNQAAMLQMEDTNEGFVTMQVWTQYKGLIELAIVAIILLIWYGPLKRAVKKFFEESV